MLHNMWAPSLSSPTIQYVPRYFLEVGISNGYCKSDTGGSKRGTGWLNYLIHPFILDPRDKQC